MILLSDYDKKLVIPRWLDYAKAARTRELSFSNASPLVLNEFTKKRLAEDYFKERSYLSKRPGIDFEGGGGNFSPKSFSRNRCL